MPINQLTDDGFGFLAGSSGATPSFAPSDIAGLKLWLDADAANVNTEAAADFNGTNQYLSSTSTAFDKGDESFSFGCWVNLDSLPASGVNRGIMGNMNPSDFEGFGLRVTNNSGVIRFKYYIEDSLGAGTDLSADIFGTPSINTWHFISCIYDSVNDLMKINVDGGAFNTVSQTTGAGGKSGLTIGTDAVLVNRYIDSKIDLAFFYDKALLQSEVTALYNSGNATAYSSLSAAQKTDLVSWWSLSETSGIRYDQKGTNNLTDNGSVGWAAGILNEPVVNNSPVSLWIDKSTATNNATQATAISQATWKSSGFGTNSKPYLNFDGVNDFMSVANSSDIQLQAMTIFMVNLPRVNAAFEGALDKWGSSQGWMIEYTSGATQGQTRITAGTSSLLSSVDVTNLENITSILIDGASSSISVNGVTTTGTLNVTPNITQDLILGGDNVSTLRLDVDMAEILIYNAPLTSGEIESVETYLNDKYAAYSPPGAFMTATGGTMTTDGNFRVHSFSSSANFTVTSLGTDPTYGSSVEYLVVAGGGSGGERAAGGGGAGGLLTASGYTVTQTPYTITVGGGGAIPANEGQGNNGSNSSFGAIAATGGGTGGGSSSLGENDGVGGGSGGGSHNNAAVGTGITGQGNNGGLGNGSTGGGGGGAGAVGGNHSGSTGGNGGNGLQSNIYLSGTNQYYAGGGGGGANATPGTGGNGGGGAGSSGTANATFGTLNTGGGGGGSGYQSTNEGNGGAGGSGIVIIRYKFQ